MGDIVNLRGARKRAARASAEKEAAQKRREFGISRRLKVVHQAQEQHRNKMLDGHRRVDSGQSRADAPAHDRLVDPKK